MSKSKLCRCGQPRAKDALFCSAMLGGISQVVGGYMKRCSRCRQEKQPTTDYFYECARHKDGLQYYCIDCSREYCRMHKARSEADA